MSSTKRVELKSRANTVYLSSASVAEIMIKASLNRLRFDYDPVACAERLGFAPLDFSATDAVLLNELPFYHRDPFDRMLIAQSLTRHLKLMTDVSPTAAAPCCSLTKFMKKLARPARVVKALDGTSKSTP